MIIASIDVGTNTVLLLIADADETSLKITPLVNEYRIPRIGRGLKPNECISEDNIEKLFAVLSEYKSIISRYNVSTVIITATNAMRLAANSAEITDEIKKRFSWSVNIISGKLEAAYAFLGAVPVSSINKNNLVIDIGGGSTELIFGKQNVIKYRKSFQIGSVSSTENYLKHSPQNDKEIAEFKFALRNIFAEIKNKLAPDFTYSVAGTPTTIFCMINNMKEYDEPIVNGGILKYDDIIKLKHDIIKLTSGEIKSMFGSIIEGRDDIILGGMLILLNIMELLNLTEVIVSSKGIRYGAIKSYLRSV